MSHTLKYNPDTDCIELTVLGTFTMDRLKSIAPEVAGLAYKSGCRRILNDMSGATIAVSFTDIYRSPAEMDQSGIRRTTRRALVVPPSFGEADFLETVTRNRGHNLRVFQDRESAMKWLRSAV